MNWVFTRFKIYFFFLRFAINPILLDYYKTTTTIIQWTAGRQAGRQGACTRCWDIICEKETNIHSFPEFYYFVLCLPSIWQLRPIRQIFASCCPLLVKVRMRLSGVLLTINRNTYIHTVWMWKHRFVYEHVGTVRQEFLAERQIEISPPQTNLTVK